MKIHSLLNSTVFKYGMIIMLATSIHLQVEAQTYPFSLPENITASLNVQTSNKEVFNNKLIGYNIQGFETQAQKDFIKLVNPVTIRFPHGVWANFYKWQTDGYQDDAYDNRDHQQALNTFVCCVKGEIDGIASLNTDRKAINNGKGYDMMWTYSINFDDGASSVARANKDIGLGLEVKAIELGNEHFWLGQRSLRTDTPAKYLAAATEVSNALKTAFPEIKLSLPLSWRKTHEGYNNSIIGNGNFFDAISLHKYMGSDPDVPGESNNAYSSLLTAKLELAEDANWVRSFAPGKPIWLTEWGVSAGSDVHGAACLGMADVYMFMAENQDVYERANWFIFNRVLNAMVVLDSNREPVYPLQKRGYLSTFEIIQDVYRDATMLKGTVTASSQLSVSRGSVNVVNARATTNEFGETKVIAVNLTDKPITFSLKFDNVEYSKNFKHEALVFDNLGVVPPIDYFENPLQLIKEGTGAILLPPLSVSKISGIYYDESIKLIPGTIEAEDYKAGGQGIGFLDTTPDNTLSAGMDTYGVDVGITNGITYVGDTQNGEWLKYDVNVLNTGDHDFEFLYAAENTGALVSMELDGVLIFDNFSLPQTGGATNFQSTTKFLISLTKGLHELKINVQNGGFSLDKLQITYLPPLEVPTFVTPKNIDNIEPGNNIKVTATTTLAPANIANMALYINNNLVRSISSAPFTWGNTGQNDVLLENIASGTYILKLVLTDFRNRTTETSITVTSNNYPTRPFSGSPHPVPGTIQLEDYDFGGQGFAFSDTTVGNQGMVYRTQSGDDVDISVGGTNYVLNVAPNEYTRYTINVDETGQYEMIVNYRTFSTTSKALAAYVLPKDLSSSRELFFDRGNSTTSGIIRSENESGSVVFLNYKSTIFNLNAGVSVLEFRIPTGGNGPNYDYITLNKAGTLSSNTIPSLVDNFIVYPVPNNTGRFHLNKQLNWKVYSVLGVEITEGSGALVDISKFSKGIYLLKTEEGVIKRLVYN